MQVIANPTQVLASNSGQSNITVTLFDENRSPLSGYEIIFSSSHGFITGSDSTDQNGNAYAVFQSVQENADVTITASLVFPDTTITEGTVISMTGIVIEVIPAIQDALINSSVPVNIKVADGEGLPVSSTAVTITGATEAAGITDGNGEINTSVTMSSEGSRDITVSALGASSSATVNFWETVPTGTEASLVGFGNMRIYVEPTELLASNTDRAAVNVVVYDYSNNPISNQEVTFSASRGIITASGTTDDMGIAQADYQSMPLNIEVTVSASITVGDSILAVATTITLKDLEVRVTPAVTDALLDTEVPVAVSVIDGAGSPVPNATVTLTGTTDSVGITNGSGEFFTTATSGFIQRRVAIRASALGDQDSAYINFWTEMPEDPIIIPVEELREMRMYSSRSQLKADNSDYAIITVILTNEFHNPAVGDSVRFQSDLGIIDEYALVDSSGRAVAILRSAPVNGICHVYAEALGRNKNASTQILFTGVTLQLIPEKTDLKINDLAVIEALLKDGSDNPIGGDLVNFEIVSGGTALFEDGQKTYSLNLDPNGKGQVRLTATAAEEVVVRASGLNTMGSVELSFSNNTLHVSAFPNNLVVGGNDTSAITATYVDGSNNPISGAVVEFATNAGVIIDDVDTTGLNGQATTRLISAHFSGTATVQATAAQGTAQTTVKFNAYEPWKITLAISPDNIGIKGGVATLTATVTDSNGNMVSGYDVNMRILKGPGGGEYITKPVAALQSGIAVSEIKAGNIPSLYRGTEVEASVINIPYIVADTSKITISGAPHIISVSRPEDDSVVVEKAGYRDPSTFDYNIGAVVQDINGNDVADGTEVHFSAVVTGQAVAHRVFVKWEGLDSFEDIEAIYKLVYRDIPFEDINNNLQMDPGIDLVLDWDPENLWRGEDRNGDGVFDYVYPTSVSGSGAHDYYFDLNGNNRCDIHVAEDEIVTFPETGDTIFFDVNGNGYRERSDLDTLPNGELRCRYSWGNCGELLVDANGNGRCDSIGYDLPVSGDFPFGEWEVRDWLSPKYLAFRDNEFAVVIETSAITKDGVAETRLSYPRQFARRLFVTVNAEANGIRDKDGERFILPKIVEER
jgi:hypothetical protein